MTVKLNFSKRLSKIALNVEFSIFNFGPLIFLFQFGLVFPQKALHYPIKTIGVLTCAATKQMADFP